jgi:iron complex outermembrane receptor protein
MPGGYARSYDFFRIRGFDASGYTYVDGLPRNVSINLELSGIESIEVNAISKRPTKDAFVDVEGSYGSYDSYEGLIDVDSPLNSAGNVYARLVLHYRDGTTRAISTFIPTPAGSMRLRR